MASNKDYAFKNQVEAIGKQLAASKETVEPVDARPQDKVSKDVETVGQRLAQMKMTQTGHKGDEKVTASDSTTPTTAKWS